MRVLGSHVVGTMLAAISVAALALQFAPEARAQALEYNIDRPGLDYSSFDLPSPDPVLCQNACLADSACRAFTYVNPGVQGPSARCWLKNDVPAQVSSTCCISGVSGGTPPPPAEQQFDNPMIDGYAVDICLNFAASCGEPAADEFCRRQGYAESLSNTVQFDTPPTLILGDNAVCAEDYCDRFSQIVCAGGSVPPPPPPPPPGGNADELWRMNATAHRGQNGQRFDYSCPPIGAVPSVSVWGTGRYTDDSAVCVAAVHAGIINAAGGTVTIEMAAGLSSYTGSTQNGVTSSGYGEWGSSYGFVGAGGMPSDGGGMPGTGGAPGAGGAFPPADQAAGATAQSCTGGTGTQCNYGCPPGFPLGAAVWGTGIYTDDSSVCNAAVHAGAISQSAGGWVTIIIADGQSSYAGSVQNGVTSREYGGWGRSFTFAGAMPGGGGGGGVGGGPCANPRTQVVMDEWLSRAIPTAEGNLRYEPWGRAVGTTPSAVITAPNPPDTHLSRCEYLLQQAPGLPSRNIGTLYEYLLKSGLI